ncbi:hypothetical protein B7934_09620 [Streptococcus agalactiae]|nr:hypothetical protein B7934_09620 [Streptococcus agalactiae]
MSFKIDYNTQSFVYFYSIHPYSNPMGGIIVKVIVNDSSKNYISYNLIKDDEGRMHYANLVVSADLSNKLGEPK